MKNIVFTPKSLINIGCILLLVAFSIIVFSIAAQTTVVAAERTHQLAALSKMREAGGLSSTESSAIADILVSSIKIENISAPLNALGSLNFTLALIAICLSVALIGFGYGRVYQAKQL